MGSRRNTAMRTASSNKNDVFSAIGSLKRGKAANFYNPVQLLQSYPCNLLKLMISKILKKSNRLESENWENVCLDTAVAK